MNRSKGKKRLVVGKNIVRAWFDTVINPLLQSLRIEEEHLERKNWSWQFRPGGLESIRNVRAHLDLEVWDNLEHFLGFYPKIGKAVQTHDEGVSLLTKKCRALQLAIENSSALRTIYRKATSPESLSKLGRTLEQLFGSYPLDDHLKLLTQYIVNNSGDLPDYYYTAPLWNNHRDEFLAVLNTPLARRHSEETAKAGESLQRYVKLLHRLLTETRLHLSLEHDVPYVTASRVHVEGAY